MAIYSALTTLKRLWLRRTSRICLNTVIFNPVALDERPPMSSMKKVPDLTPSVSGMPLLYALRLSQKLLTECVFELNAGRYSGG